eukprot:scaffold677694_cov112-Prasinocladus_malaysianus.AAC.1
MDFRVSHHIDADLTSMFSLNLLLSVFLCDGDSSGTGLEWVSLVSVKASLIFACILTLPAAQHHGGMAKQHCFAIINTLQLH